MGVLMDVYDCMEIDTKALYPKKTPVIGLQVSGELVSGKNEFYRWRRGT